MAGTQPQPGRFILHYKHGITEADYTQRPRDDQGANDQGASSLPRKFVALRGGRADRAGR
jgi:hypothetical protein